MSVCESVKEKENRKMTDDLIKVKYIHYKSLIGLLGVRHVKADRQLET